MTSFEKLTVNARPRVKKEYATHGFWNNALLLSHYFALSFSYELPVTRELLDKMKLNNKEEYYNIINNELIFEQAEGYHSQVWGLLTEEERLHCIGFHSTAPIQTISEAALGCGDEQAFYKSWTLDTPFSKEALDTLQRLEASNKIMDSIINNKIQ